MSIESQIAEHCNEESNECPCCKSQLQEFNNEYGTWYECTVCFYETEQF